MKIIDRRIDFNVCLNQLKPTDIFEICGNKYMKLENSYDTENLGIINAIDIRTGRIAYVGEKSMVRPLQTELIIKK